MITFRGQNDHLKGRRSAEGGRNSELPLHRHASCLRKTMNFRELQEGLTPGKAGRKHCGQPWIGCRRRLSASAFHHVRATAPFVLIHSTLPRDERAIRPHPFTHGEKNVSTRGKNVSTRGKKHFRTEKKHFRTRKDSGHKNSTNNTKQQKRHSLHSCYSCYSCSVKTQPRLPRYSGSVTRKRGLSVCSRRRISFMRATISGCCTETSWSSWRSAARL